MDLDGQVFHSIWHNLFPHPVTYQKSPAQFRQVFCLVLPLVVSAQTLVAPTTSVIFFWVLNLLFSGWCVDFSQLDLSPLEQRITSYLFHA